jgi:sugar-specific transcriptional regulator TrmB
MFPKVSGGLELPVGETARKILREIGLGAHEVDVYLVLLEAEEKTAMEVSDKAKVPYSKIYGVLNNLKDRGWVKSVESRPTKYYALSPLEAVANEKLTLEDRQRAWEKVVINELQPLYEKQEVVEHSDMLVLHSQQAVLDKLEELAKRANNEIVIAAPGFAKLMILSASSMFEELRKGHVKVKAMVAGEPETWKTLGEVGTVIELRFRDEMFGGGIIVDGKEAMLFLGEEKPSLVIWSNHIGLVRFARDYFEFLWNSSRASK